LPVVRASYTGRFLFRQQPIPLISRRRPTKAPAEARGLPVAYQIDAIAIGPRAIAFSYVCSVAAARSRQ